MTCTPLDVRSVQWLPCLRGQRIYIQRDDDGASWWREVVARRFQAHHSCGVARSRTWASRTGSLCCTRMGCGVISVRICCRYFHLHIRLPNDRTCFHSKYKVGASRTQGLTLWSMTVQVHYDIQIAKREVDSINIANSLHLGTALTKLSQSTPKLL